MSSRALKSLILAKFISSKGYKFETLCLIPDQWDAVSRDSIENREHETVSNYAQYCSVVRTGFGKASLVIGGEVDAGVLTIKPVFDCILTTFIVWDCKPEDKEQPINWVELKTAEDIQSDGDLLKFERKLLKFWAQSFLLGVPKIIVGFRTRDGVLRRLEELETQKIPGNVKRLGKGSWDGNLCINFTASFLDCKFSSFGDIRVHKCTNYATKSLEDHNHEGGRLED